MSFRIAAGMLVALTLLAGAAPADAAFFFADDPKDLPDAQLDGVCATVNGTCTIRAAIQEANFVPGEDVVSIPAGKYTLSRKGAGEDAALTGDLDVTQNLTINGVFRGTVVKGKKDRVLDVFPGVTITLRNIAFQGGSVGGRNVVGDDASGGCIRNRGTVLASSVTLTSCKATNDGGAVANLGGAFGMSGTVAKSKAGRDGGGLATTGGTLGLGGVNVTKNKAGGAGGGVAAHGDFTADGTTFDGNVAGAGGGGALAVVAGTSALTNVTVSGNKTKGAGGGVLVVDAPAVANLVHATLVGNKSKLAGAALANPAAGTLSLSGSLLDRNKKVACGGTLTTLGGNVADTTACGLGVGEISGVEDLGVAKLAPNNAGTFTHLLKPGSPALDAAVDADCPTEDQRLLPRPIDVPGVGTTTCDAGAVEMQLDELAP